MAWFIPTLLLVYKFCVVTVPLLLNVVEFIVAKLLKLRFESTIVTPPILYVFDALISPFTSKVYDAEVWLIPTLLLVYKFCVFTVPLLLNVVEFIVCILLKLRLESTIVVVPIL